MKGLYCKLGEAKELKFIIQETVSIDSIVHCSIGSFTLERDTLSGNPTVYRYTNTD